MFVIIDEYSMIHADMLYKLDLRLKEIKQKTSLPFGGVALFLFGDVLQLRPVRARYVFDEPKNESFYLSYLANPLWEKFEVILLNKNHRQGEDMEYANILNRLREGNVDDKDLEVLQTRVRPINHPDIPKEALIVTCTNDEVNRINGEMLSELPGDEHVIEVLNRSSNNKVTKPRIDNTGAVRNTPLQKTLKLKIGAKVMLTHNSDTCDCLTNGTFGVVIGLDFGKDGRISRIIVNP